MIKYFFFLSSTLLFFTGCNIQKEPKPATQLSQEVQELEAVDKKLIYRAIQDEIDLYNLQGDEAYSTMAYYDALESYEMVNFYEGYDYIPRAKIEKIKQEIHIRSVLHYKKAINTKDAKIELRELNLVMMNNPEFKDTKELYQKSKLKRKNKIFLNSLENSLQMKLLNFHESLESVSAINADIKKLNKYDYKNTITLKAKELVTSKHNKLLQEAITLYDDNKILDAKKSFLRLSSIYKDDRESQRYLKKIELLESKKINLTKASIALSKENYKSAISYANKVLNLDSQNKKAKEIIASSKQLSTAKVNRLLQEGKYNYNKKKLDRAKNIFNSILTMDANNSTALLYSKKIDRQLQTINSLQ